MSGPAEERRAIAQSVTVLLDRIGALQRVRRVRDAWPLFDRPAWQAMAGAGWLGSLVPEAQGGCGLELDQACALLEGAGARLALEPLAPGIGAAMLLARSPAPCAAPLLQELLAGERVLVPVADADPWPGEPRIEVTRTSGGFRLHGATAHIAECQGATDFVIGVAPAGEFLVLHVEASSPGLGLQVEPGADGSSIGRLRFDALAVDAQHVLLEGAPAAAAFQALTDVLRLGHSAQLVGLAGEALRLTLEYMKTREQFGRQIGAFQALQHRAASAYIEVTVSRSLLYEACRAFGSDKQQRAAAAVAARACSAALGVAKECIQMHGAIGFADEHDIGLFLRRAMALAGAVGGETANHRRFAAVC